MEKFNLVTQSNESLFIPCHSFHLRLYNIDSLNVLMNISFIYFCGSQNVAKGLRIINNGKVSFAFVELPTSTWQKHYKHMGLTIGI